MLAGPCCDKFGPRNTFAGCLLLGAIPSFCAGGIQNASGLMAVRFFIGILGGSFVPCQVWTTGFFDKNTVGAANALTAGWGNAGGGITYFVMPHIYTALVGDGLSPDVAWRVDFVFPSIIISITAVAMVLLCPDTPVGKWSERFDAVESNLKKHHVVVVPGEINAETKSAEEKSSPSASDKDIEKKAPEPESFSSNEIHLSSEEMIDTAKGEVIVTPTAKETMKVIMSPQTITLAACYFCSFGAELAINGVLGTYYGTKFPSLGLTGAGDWAAMFGLLNFVCRPLGGLVSDMAYRASGHNLWVKKILIHVYGLIQGAFLVAIGVLNSSSQSTTFGLFAGLAFFLEGGNGMNYSLLPHVHPYANGVVAGFTGAMGNFGGIIFACVFRGESTAVNKGFWIMGVMVMAINVLVCWIKPIPKNQIGGR